MNRKSSQKKLGDYLLLEEGRALIDFAWSWEYVFVFLHFLTGEKDDPRARLM